MGIIIISIKNKYNMKNDKKNTEYEHFSTLAREWWSKNGKFKLLHDIQPLRTEYILKSLNKKKIK